MYRCSSWQADPPVRTFLCRNTVFSSHGNALQGHALLLVWLANTVPRPPSKRSAAIAVVNACGNIGTMSVLSVTSEHPECLMHTDALSCSRISSFVWKVEWSPQYHQSMFVGIAALAIGTSLATGDLVAPSSKSLATMQLSNQRVSQLFAICWLARTRNSRLRSSVIGPQRRKNGSRRLLDWSVFHTRRPVFGGVVSATYFESTWTIMYLPLTSQSI